MDDIILTVPEQGGPTELDLFLNRQAEELMRMFITNLNNTIAMIKSSDLLMEEQLVAALNHVAMQACFNFLTNLTLKYASSGYEHEFFKDFQDKFKIHCDAVLENIKRGAAAGAGEKLNG